MNAMFDAQRCELGTASARDTHRWEERGYRHQQRNYVA